MKDKATQSLTAYKCRICRKNHNDDLLMDNEDQILDLREILYEYFDLIKKCQIDSYTNRAIQMLDNPIETELDDGMIRIQLSPDAGKALENFCVVNYKNNTRTRFKGEDNSAVYPHYVFCYLKEQDNIFVFHRYGNSGCKTAFLNTFNRFLSQRGLIAHFDIRLSSEMFENTANCIPEKLSLITMYSKQSTDAADNMSNEKKENVEQEVIISLNAPRAKSIKDWIKSIREYTPNIDELKSILIENNFSSDFEDAKLTLKFGKVRRRISLSEFTGLIAEYDITDKLEILADKTVNIKSLTKISDEYVLSFFR